MNTSTSRAERLKQYWAEVRAGLREAPRRSSNGSITRKTRETLDGTFGLDRGRAIIVTLHPDGRIELRPERTRRSETLSLKDVYRFAMQCRANREWAKKMQERKAKKAEVRERRSIERAERRLFGKE